MDSGSKVEVSVNYKMRGNKRQKIVNPDKKLQIILSTNRYDYELSVDK